MLLGIRLGLDGVNPIYYDTIKVRLFLRFSILHFLIESRLFAHVGTLHIPPICGYRWRPPRLLILLCRVPGRQPILPRSTPRQSQLYHIAQRHLCIPGIASQLLIPIVIKTLKIARTDGHLIQLITGPQLHHLLSVQAPRPSHTMPRFLLRHCSSNSLILLIRPTRPMLPRIPSHNLYHNLQHNPLHTRDGSPQVSPHRLPSVRTWISENSVGLELWVVD